MTKAPTWQAILWHMPGRIWAGMMAVVIVAARFWAQVGAAMALTIVFVGYGVVIWKGPWPVDRAQQQLDLLGQGHLLAGFLVLVALVCITGIRVGFDASRQGIRANIDRDDDDEPPVAPKVITTTTTEVTPAVPAAPKPTDPEAGDARPV